ncbi:MAG: hypothetical protein IPH20_00045 [Bacteroidales bacterium]|nr:hypothetical protein [Bacteroidales bacterium]
MVPQHLQPLQLGPVSLVAASQVPVQFGGTSPGVLADEVRGTKAGLIVYSPWLTSGDDAAGTGFQPTGSCGGTPVEIASSLPTHIYCGGTTRLHFTQLQWWFAKLYY